MISNSKLLIKNINKFNYSIVKKYSTLNYNHHQNSNNNSNNNNNNINNSKQEQDQSQSQLQSKPPTNNYCHNYFSDVQNYKSYDDDVQLIKQSNNKSNSSTLSSQKKEYSGIFGSIKEQLDHLSNIVKVGVITFRNDRVLYRDNLLPKASVLQESLYKRIVPTFQYHNHDSYYYLNFHERKSILQYRNDRLTFIPLAIFLSIPFSTLALPFYFKYLPGLLPRGFSERSQVLSRHEKMMHLRERFARKLLAKYELQDKVDNLFPNIKSLADINPLKVKELDESFNLDFLEIKRKRLKTICRSLGESTILNSNQLLKDKILGFGDYIVNENDQIIKEINSLTFEDFQDLLYQRSLSFKGLNYHEMKDKFIKYSQLLKSLQSLEVEDTNQPLSKEHLMIKGFYKRFILLNSIIIHFKL